MCFILRVHFYSADAAIVNDYAPHHSIPSSLCTDLNIEGICFLFVFLVFCVLFFTKMRSSEDSCVFYFCYHQKVTHLPIGQAMKQLMLLVNPCATGNCVVFMLLIALI